MEQQGPSDLDAANLTVDGSRRCMEINVQENSFGRRAIFPTPPTGVQWFLYAKARSRNITTCGEQKPLPPRVNVCASRAIRGSINR